MTICAHCHTENRATARFCCGCGRPLTTETDAAAAEMAMEQQQPADAPSPFSEGVWLTYGLATVQGTEQAINQDSLLALSLLPLAVGRPAPALGLFALADGMSWELGEVASRLAIRVLAQGVIAQVVLREMNDDPCLDETLATALAESVEDANASLCAAAQYQGISLASTMAAVLLRNEVAIVAAVGDTRVYHWHGGVLRQVTTDHSVVERLLETGQISAEEVATHPQRGVLYRYLGSRPEVEVDIFTLRLAPGDRLLLCCDGLWQCLSEEVLAEALSSVGEPQGVCDALIGRAQAAGATDNASVLVIGVQDADRSIERRKEP